MDQVLRPITNTEFSTWLSQAITFYATDKVASGAWLEDGAQDRSRREHEALLPEGPDTPNHSIFSILDESGATVGAIWFAAETRGDIRVAYVYNILIWPEHRRQGHASRAFQALDRECRRRGFAGIALHVFAHNTAAQNLYARLGFKPTNFNLYRSVGAADA
jgi:ribosomal protein S18 acetylase RimI-like enzyme